MGAEITVRAARREDLRAILEIYNDAVLKTTASYDYEPRTLEHRTAWFESHERSGLPIFVALRDGRVVGWSSLSSYHDRKGYQFTVENSVYVAESHRGTGVGKALLQPLIDAGQRLKLHVIIAVIDANNAASVKLHANHGFIQVGHFKEVGFKFNCWLDVIYMQLTL